MKSIPTKILLLVLLLSAPASFAENFWESRIREAAKAAALPELDALELRAVARAFHTGVPADLLQRIVLALPDFPLRDGRLTLTNQALCTFLTNLQLGKEPFMKEVCTDGLLQSAEVLAGEAGARHIRIQLKASTELRNKAYLYTYVLRGPVLSWTRAPRPQVALEMRNLFEKIKAERRLMILRSNYTEIMKSTDASARRVYESAASLEPLVFEALDEGSVSLKMLGLEFTVRKAQVLWTEQGQVLLLGEVDHPTHGVFMRAFGAATGF